MILICVGNGQQEADIQSQKIAKDRFLLYNGILDDSTVLSNGVWHTSIYDIKIPQLVDKIKSQQIKIEIVMLDQKESEYSDFAEYSFTLEFGKQLQSVADVVYVNSEMKNTLIDELASNKSICAMPFIGAHLHENNCYICCISVQHPIAENLKNFKSDPTFKDIREKMKSGEKISYCTHCYEQESRGYNSPRIDLTTEWANKMNIRSVQQLTDFTTPVYYQISTGNLCNAMCRSCDPSASDLIAKEYETIGWHKRIEPQKQNRFLDIDISTAKKVYVNGGEPTISKDLYSFLENCIELNRTDLEIVINTNAMSIKPKFLSLVSYFNNLKFEISIDGINDLLTYIRWPIEWNTFSKNIETLYQATNSKISFNTVVSIYNVSCLYEIIEWITVFYPKSETHISVLKSPEVLVATNFPNKDKALKNLNKIKLLKRYSTSHVFKNDIDSLIRMITNTPINSDKLSDFFEFNNKLDESRNVRLSDYVPELNINWLK